MASPRKVIVFGATGATGSFTALQAHQEGAQVSLAVRDPSKPIPALDGIPVQKVQADLTKPESLTEAVRQTGATAAYLYAIFGLDDHMRASLVALKEAGIEFIVLLSSFTVKGELRAIPPSDFISYVHAQVEISLEDVFGKENFVALRPAFFSSNIFWFKEGLSAGNVRHANPDAVFDYISPADIGRVAGSILVNGTDEHAVYIAGPEKLTITEAVALVGKVLGREITTTRVSFQEMKDVLMDHGTPEPVAQWAVNDVTENPGSFYAFPWYQQAMESVKKYTNRDPTPFLQWLEENKSEF